MCTTLYFGVSKTLPAALTRHVSSSPFLCFPRTPSCLPCDGSTAVADTVLGDCVCAVGNSVLVETASSGVLLAQKVCQACPPRTRVFSTAVGGRPADPYTCQACSDPLMTMTAAGTSRLRDPHTQTHLHTRVINVALPHADRPAFLFPRACLGQFGSPRLLLWVLGLLLSPHRRM